MESVSYSNFQAKVHVALFTAVSNSKDIRQRIIKASTAEGASGDAEREAVNFAFIDAKLIASRRHLLTAVYQSMLADNQKTLKTKTVHSEIIYSLHPDHNITEAFRRFGVNDKSSALLVVRIAGLSDTRDIEKSMKDVVEGNLSSMSELQEITDWSLISKYYKLNSEPVMLAEKDELKRRRAIEELVTSFVAMKSIAS